MSQAAAQKKWADEEEVSAAESLSQQGEAAFEAGRTAEAAGLFVQALQEDQTHAEAWNGLGVALFSSNKFTEAERAFESCVECDPNHPTARTNLAQTLWHQGRPIAAAAIAREELSKDPENVEAGSLIKEIAAAGLLKSTFQG